MSFAALTLPTLTVLGQAGDAPKSSTVSVQKPAPQPSAAAQKPPAQVRPSGDEGLPSCHRHDISCTVVHETSRGLIVITVRPRGREKDGRWSVVTTANPREAAETGQLIYVLPQDAGNASNLGSRVEVSANQAPIID
jgi:hypothetical protein